MKHVRCEEIFTWIPSTDAPFVDKAYKGGTMTLAELFPNHYASVPDDLGQQLIDSFHAFELAAKRIGEYLKGRV